MKAHLPLLCKWSVTASLQCVIDNLYAFKPWTDIFVNNFQLQPLGLGYASLSSTAILLIYLT